MHEFMLKFYIIAQEQTATTSDYLKEFQTYVNITKSVDGAIGRYPQLVSEALPSPGVLM